MEKEETLFSFTIPASIAGTNQRISVDISSLGIASGRKPRVIQVMSNTTNIITWLFGYTNTQIQIQCYSIAGTSGDVTAYVRVLP